MRMKELQFNNPIFKSGENITVRRGVKWSLEDEAIILGLGERPIGAQVKRFADITDYDLINEHDPDCRSKDGLLSVMEGIYDKFDTKEIVTLVSFIGTEE